MFDLRSPSSPQRAAAMTVSDTRLVIDSISVLSSAFMTASKVSLMKLWTRRGSEKRTNWRTSVTNQSVMVSDKYRRLDRHWNAVKSQTTHEGQKLEVEGLMFEIVPDVIGKLPPPCARTDKICIQLCISWYNEQWWYLYSYNGSTYPPSPPWSTQLVYLIGVKAISASAITSTQKEKSRTPLRWKRGSPSTARNACQLYRCEKGDNAYSYSCSHL